MLVLVLVLVVLVLVVMVMRAAGMMRDLFRANCGQPM